jgi:uncharacterized membrane protein
MTAAQEAILFRAEVTPHRSLSARGMRRVVGFVCAVSLCTTTLFWHLGAWPIAGFNGGEIALATVLLRMHHRSARAREVLMLSGSGLRIERTDSRGAASECVLPSFWLNVVLTERPGRAPGLFLSSRGQQIEVATALGEAEKRDLAAALKEALYRFRNPVFDNPQLRNQPG